MLKLYLEDEILYFDTIFELKEKLELYLNDSVLWTELVEKSRKRLFSSGHDIKSRMTELLSIVEQL